MSGMTDLLAGALAQEAAKTTGKAQLGEEPRPSSETGALFSSGSFRTVSLATGDRRRALRPVVATNRFAVPPAVHLFHCLLASALLTYPMIQGIRLWPSRAGPAGGWRSL
jgi:hypothetical protein